MDDVDDIDLESAVVEIAFLHERERDRFAEAAAALAERIGPLGEEGHEMLIDILEPLPEVPPELDDVSDVAWRDACGAAVVATLDACGPDAVEALFDIAVGHAPGPAEQAEAVLVRFAKDGVATAGIVNRLVEAIDVEEYVSDDLHKFVAIGHVTPELIDKVREMIDRHLGDETASDNAEVIAIIDVLIILSHDDAVPYVPALRGWVLKGISYGPGDEGYTESEAPIIEWNGIRAALVLHRLYPNDAPIREALRYWSETHVNEEVREMILENLKAEE